VAVTGDVGMLHDIGALATLQRTEASVVIVVVNNDGGGIFHFLPQSGHRYFERHFGGGVDLYDAHSLQPIPEWADTCPSTRYVVIARKAD